jgi:hypothetical protein
MQFRERRHLDRNSWNSCRSTPFFPIFQTCLVQAIWSFRQTLDGLRSINHAALLELRGGHAFPSAV